MSLSADYRPQQVNVCYQLAQFLFDKGDFKSTVRMLKDFHKDFPGDEHVLPAYKMMVEALSFISGLEQQAAKFQAVVQKLEQQTLQGNYKKKAELAVTTSPGGKANFSLEEKVEDEKKTLDYGHIEFTP